MLPSKETKRNNAPRVRGASRAFSPFTVVNAPPAITQTKQIIEIAKKVKCANVKGKKKEKIHERKRGKKKDIKMPSEIHERKRKRKRYKNAQ